MWLCYDIPERVTCTASVPWLTPVRLHGRDPQTRTRFAWPAGAQSTATKVEIFGNFSDGPIVPQGGALLSVKGLSPGTRVTIQGAVSPRNFRPLGGNSLTQRLGVLPDGSLGIFWLFDEGLPAMSSYYLTIFNDVNGSVGIEPGAIIELGQIVVAPGLFIEHLDDSTDGTVDSSRSARVIGGAFSRVRRAQWRSMSIPPLWCNESLAYGVGLASGISYATLQSRLAADPFVLVIRDPRPGYMQATSLLGVIADGKIPQLKKLEGPYWQFDTFQFEGVPN